MFQKVKAAPPDAILGISEAFRADSNPEKINLSVGVYQDESGATPKLAAVQSAEEQMVAEASGGGYLPIDGLREYGQLVQQLLLGADNSLIGANRVATVQTPGGTGALRVAADFIRNNLHHEKQKVWFPNPTWGNHLNVFRAAGHETASYDYYDAANFSLDFEAMKAALEQIPSGDVILLHACCHNPTGVDLDADQWKQVAKIVSERELLPIVDFAYQGFGDGVDADALGLRTICESSPSVLACNSFSKNISMYRERIGALTAISDSADTTSAVLSQLKRAVRCNYSNPPYHGGAVVARVLGDADLRKNWLDELSQMRHRIHKVRAEFSETLNRIQQKRDFSFINSQRGMFSFSGLNPEQVERLRTEHSIYLVGNGRMNVAGMNSRNVEKVCQAVAAAM